MGDEAAAKTCAWQTSTRRAASAARAAKQEAEAGEHVFFLDSVRESFACDDAAKMPKEEKKRAAAIEWHRQLTRRKCPSRALYFSRQKNK